MKFTLFHSGRIRSSNKRNSKHIDEIRLSLSPQIKQLYDYEPLKSLDVKCEPGDYTNNDIYTYLEVGKRNYSCLVNKGFGLACRLNITFFEASGTLSVANDIGDMGQ
jgi:hypothetical protein